MKKSISIIMIMILLMVNIPLSLAQSNDYKNLRVNGKEMKVRTIDVTIDKEPIKSDVPPILYNSRTLVPVRFFMDYIDADIEWNGDKQIVTISTDDKDISIKINSPNIVVNDKEEELPDGVPAILVNSRTMVPLRFIAETLGFDIGWDSETYTAIAKSPEKEDKEEKITDVIVEERGLLPKIKINTTGKLKYDITYLDDSNKIVVDLHKGILDLDDEKYDINNRGIANLDFDNDNIEDIKVAQFSDDPKISRVVIELDEYMDYDTEYSDDGQTLNLSFVNKVKEVKIDKRGRDKIVIENTNNPKYNIFRLSNPDRIVVDIMGSVTGFNEDKIEKETDYVDRIRMSQFTPDSLYNRGDNIVRVVVDVKEMDRKPNLSTEVDDNDIVLYVDDEDVDDIDYDYEDKIGNLEIETDRNPDYELKFNEEDKKMDIKISSKDLDIENTIQQINDELVENIIVKNSGDKKLITVNFNTYIEYELKSIEKDDEIVLQFHEKENITPFSDKLIVIDAGHGGHDPGTHGLISKVNEKDLNLNVALKLDKKLRELGFKTILTRSDDTFVDLYERAEIANRANADAFVSIHFNAHPNRDIDGIQTLYCPSYNGTAKTGPNFPFSETIHNSMLGDLRLRDRGIVKRSGLVVVRETNMVAIIAELGFLSNPQEELKIIKDKYHEQAAESISKGIVQYFSK